MFLSPLFLIGGLIAATIPALLHLLQKRRRTTIAFPTLRFLRMAEKKSARRMHFENILLWLLRTLILLLLGVAFAMPVMRGTAMAWLQRAPRDVAIVLDVSYSMGYERDRGSSVWEQSVDAAVRILDGLDDQDRYCLYLAGDEPEPLVAEPVGDREAGIRLLKAAAPHPAGSRLAPAIRAAMTALEREASGRERELYVITDGQALPWRGAAETGVDDGSGPGDQESRIDPGDRGTRLFAALLGAPAPVNLTPVSLSLDPPVVLPDTPVRVTAAFRHNGPEQESVARLVVDGEEIARRPLRFTPGGEAEATFTLPPRPAGRYEARVEILEDALAIDNAFHFLLRVRDRLPVLCAGTEADTVFLRTALRAILSGAGGGEPERIDADALASRPLDELTAVFLCNAIPLSGEIMNAVEDYARGGGTLVILPGDRASAGDYRSWATLPLDGLALRDLTGDERSRPMVWSPDPHELLTDFRDVTVPRMSVRRLLFADQLADEAGVLVYHGADLPLLLERRVGKGRVLLFTVPADRSWSDFPISPFFLPLIASVIDYSAGVGSAAPFVWSTPSIPLVQAVPGGGRETVVEGPDGVIRQPASVIDSGEVRLRIGPLDEPGIYRVPGIGPVLAVNLTREESDLTPLKDGGLDRLFGDGTPRVARDVESLMRMIDEHRLGRTYGEHLLWIVLLLVAVEYIYANLLARARPSLTDKLSVDPSGRVKGHSEVSA